MKRSDFDLGGVFAFLLATAMTGLTIGLLLVEQVGHPLYWLIFMAAPVAAWLGFWGWRRRRWLVAAGAFLLSIAWPLGFGIVVSAALSFSLFLVSLARAWSDRPRRRALLGRVPRERPSPG